MLQCIRCVPVWCHRSIVSYVLSYCKSIRGQSRTGNLRSTNNYQPQKADTGIYLRIDVLLVAMCFRVYVPYGGRFFIYFLYLRGGQMTTVMFFYFFRLAPGSASTRKLFPETPGITATHPRGASFTLASYSAPWGVYSQQNCRPIGIFGRSEPSSK